VLLRRFVQSAAERDEVLGRDRSCATALNIGASARRGAARRKNMSMSIFVDKVFALSRLVIADALRTSRLRRTADALSACAAENGF
jgi:hypothetical protein